MLYRACHSHGKSVYTTKSEFLSIPQQISYYNIFLSKMCTKFYLLCIKYYSVFDFFGIFIVKNISVIIFLYFNFVQFIQKSLPCYCGRAQGRGLSPADCRGDSRVVRSKSLLLREKGDHEVVDEELV